MREKIKRFLCWHDYATDYKLHYDGKCFCYYYRCSKCGKALAEKWVL